MPEIPRVDVAVTVVYHGEQLLLVHNPSWGAFTLPMTKIRTKSAGLDAGAERREAGSDAALRNVAEVLGKTTQREAGLLCDMPELQQSDRSGRVQHYHLEVFGFPVEEGVVPPGLIAEWLARDEVLDPGRRPISPTARRVVARLIEASQDHGGSFPPPVRGGLRSSESRIAIMERRVKNSPQWLVQYNERWGRYFLVGGHAKTGEPALDCLQREISEELDLAPSDYAVGGDRLLDFAAWSASAWQDTRYQMTAFEVSLNPNAEQRVSNAAANRWVTANEVRAECCLDGRLISPAARRVLSELGKIADF